MIVLFTSGFSAFLFLVVLAVFFRWVFKNIPVEGEKPSNEESLGGAL